MQKQDPNQKHYFNPIESKDQQIDHFQKFSSDQIFTLWEEGKSESNTEEFFFLSFDSSSFSIKLKRNAGLLDKLKGSALPNKTVLFRTSKGSRKYFSKGPLKFDDASGYYELFVEPPVYMAQQRSDYRLEIDPKLINVKLLWKEMDFQVNDISAGGLSLMLDEDDSSFLKGKQFIEECKLIFKDVQFIIPSISILKTWTVENPDTGGVFTCYGMKFQGMAAKMEDRLAQMVAMEARGKEIRKILDDKKKSR